MKKHPTTEHGVLQRKTTSRLTVLCVGVFEIRSHLHRRVNVCGRVWAWDGAVNRFGTGRGHQGACWDTPKVGHCEDGVLGLGGDGDWVRTHVPVRCPVWAWTGGGGEVGALRAQSGRSACNRGGSGNGGILKQLLEAVPARGRGNRSWDGRGCWGVRDGRWVGESDGCVHHLFLALAWWIGHLGWHLLERWETRYVPTLLPGGGAPSGKEDSGTAVGDWVGNEGRLLDGDRSWQSLPARMAHTYRGTENDRVGFKLGII